MATQLSVTPGAVVVNTVGNNAFVEVDPTLLSQLFMVLVTSFVHRSIYCNDKLITIDRATLYVLRGLLQRHPTPKVSRHFSIEIDRILER